jgi:hypothetical protein
MLQFLTLLIDWVAGFAMMFLGLSYTTPESCDVRMHVMPVHYVESVEPSDLQMVSCASYETEDDEEVEVFRI